jgi:hypothetical protein
LRGSPIAAMVYSNHENALGYCISMYPRVAFNAECDQVLILVVARMAPELLMVYL